MIVMMTYL